MYSLIVAEVTEFTGHTNMVLLFGLTLLGGTFASKLFQRIHIPQVVGCIVIGIILGDGLKLIDHNVIEKLRPFTMLALGAIGFMIGGELRGDVFKKYGRQFFIILLAQGIGAFVLVAVFTGSAMFLFDFDIKTSAAAGLILGAIASATAPAATVNVLWEFKTRGPLTAAILAIVALDDGLALLLYRGAVSAADILIGKSHASVLTATGILFAEITGAVVLGFLAGMSLYLLLKFVRADDKVLGFTLAALLIVVGVSLIPKIDPILPAMAFGITIANLAPRQSKNTFHLFEKFSPPIFTIFFVMAGAHMRFGQLVPWLIVMITIYIVFRAIGKIFGSWWGARYSGSPKTVQKYLGICLLPQAGVAIGLAIISGQKFDSALGRNIIMIVMTATFIMEIAGPMLVKVGVKKAGEVGMNITEDDLIASYNVSDVMHEDVPVISAGMPIDEVIGVVSTSSSFYYAVTDAKDHLLGAITLDGIRNTFASQELQGWLIALDIVEPVIGTVNPQTPLADAFEQAHKLDTEYLPVVLKQDKDTYSGVLDCRAVRRSLSAEVLSRQQKADSLAI